MFETVKTLFKGASARQEAALRDHYSIDLIDQKIRETEQALTAAKATMAGQIQRQRAEQGQLEALTKRIKDLTNRTAKALDADNQELAQQAATAIAQLENEQAVRLNSLDRLETHIEKLRLSVERGQRRLLDLKQGAIAAKAVKAEQRANTRLSKVSGGAPAQEAQALIDEVLAKDSPSDLAEIYEEIEEDVNHSNIEERLGAAGFGNKTKVSADDVLARFAKK
ncbi:MAG: PspA/IM30 family protein [Rhodobacteraceae bacterium]|nr:PspA/IM30 family protein [Paracoccaceae bacterium]